jgi:hypothetical protein
LADWWQHTVVKAGNKTASIRFANCAPVIVELFAIMPTDGTRLPIVRSGNVGASPFLGQLPGKQRGSTLLGLYAAFGSLPINMSASPPSHCCGYTPQDRGHSNRANDNQGRQHCELLFYRIEKLKRIPIILKHSLHA